MKKFSLFVAVLFGGSLAMAQLNAPDAVYPVDSAVAADVNVRLDWDPATGGTVTGYECQLSLNRNFTNPTALQAYGTSAKTNELTYNTRYYWRVRAKNATTTSAWSDTMTFVTFNDEFTGLAPSNADRNPNLRLRWDTIPGTTFYQYEYADNSGFTNSHLGVLKAPYPDPDSAPSGKAEAQLRELMFGTTYWWRVRAHHGKDTSAWSDTIMFTVRSTVELSSPADAAININPEVKLRCDKKNASGVEEFRIEISDDSTFNPNATYLHTYVVYAKDFSGDVVEATAEYLDFGKVYYWRARGVHNKDVSDWSAYRTLTTLDEVTLESPSDNATNLGITDVNFKFKEVRGSEGYFMELDTDPAFGNPRKVTIPTLGADIKEGVVTVVLNIASSHTIPYNWRVRTYHFRDTSNWSSVRTFTTLPVGIVERADALRMSLYPNPASNKVFIEMAGTGSERTVLELYSIVGEKVDEQLISSNTGVYTYDISSLKKGVYMLTLNKGQERITQRLIVK